MVEIYKSLPINGARRLPYKGGQTGVQTMSSQAKSELTAHLIDDKVDEERSFPHDQIATHNMIEPLVYQNRLLNEEVLKLTEELAKLQKKQVELLSQQSALEEQFKSKGYEAGYREGLDQAARDEKDRIAQLVSAVEMFNYRLSEDLAVMQKDSILLAYEALVLIVGEQYKTPEFLRATLESAISRIVEKKNIRLHLSKTDCELVGEMLANNVFQFGGSITIVADDRVRKGGCILETENGIWDARLDSQLERIKDALVITQDGLRK